jgi:hypothetical protein
MVFTTASGLIHTKNSEIPVLDGTFNIAPDGFTQVITTQVKM